MCYDDGMKKSKQISAGMMRAVTGGRISVNAPIGYSHRYVNGATTLMPDDKAPMIKEAFALYLTNQYSINQLSNHLQEKYGYPLPRSTLHRALKNPFYYGEMVYLGELYPHNYETLISRDDFEEVQLLIGGKRRTKRQKNRFYDRLYRKLINCIICDTWLTPEKKKEKYIYYKCHRYKVKHDCKPIREEKINEALIPLFNSMGIDEKIFESSTKMRVAFSLIFSKIYGNIDGTIGYELRDNIKSANIAAYINQNIQDSPEIKKAIQKEVNKYTSPLMRLCATPQSLDTICEELSLELMDAQMQLMDLQMQDKIEETQDGLWKTK